MIAMALACSPKLLIADEPTTALDVTIQAQILDLIDGLRRDLKMAVILITHDLGVIAARANRVMVMYAGKIVEGAGTDELFADMRHPYSEALFRSIPRLDHDRAQALYSIPGVPPDLSARCGGVPVRAALPLRDRALPGRGAAPCSGVELREEAGRWRGAHGHAGSARRESCGDHVFACFHPVRASSTDRAATEDAPPIRVLERDTPGPGAERDVLLEIDRLVKEFPVTSGAIVQRKIGTVKAVSDVSFSVRRGETFGLVGESGCGKTTIGWLIVALHRATAGSIRFEGEDVTKLRRSALQRPASRPAADVPGSVRVARPPHARRADRARAARRPGHRVAVEAARARRRAAVRGRPVAACGRALPARVLGRPAAAHRPRAGARAQPEADRRGRAGLGARRLDPGPDPQPDARAAARASADLRRHLARSRGGEVPGRHHRRHVPRQARRDRTGGGHLRAHGASLHAGSDRLDRDSRSGRRACAQDRTRARRAPLGDHAPVGLSLPHAVPARPGDLRRGGAAAAAVRSGHTSPPATSRCRRPSSAAAAAPRRHRAARRRRS